MATAGGNPRRTASKKAASKKAASKKAGAEETAKRAAAREPAVKRSSVAKESVAKESVAKESVAKEAVVEERAVEVIDLTGTVPQRSSTELVPIPVVDEDGASASTDGSRLGDVDEWGRSEHIRELAHKLFEPLYRNWFRVEWEGLDRIPKRGGALLVSNHAGAIPPDAPSIMHGIETELGRPVYGMADQFFKQMPVVGTLWARGGGVVAHPDNAYRLLREQHQLALVFPEGTKGTSKTFDQRYQLRRFGRGGFVEIAMRSGVPVVPIAVVGAEEAMPILMNLAPLAKLIGAPYVPVTANMVALGPLLGLAGYFPAKIKIRVLEPVHFDVEPDQPRYSRSRILEESENIRGQIQEALHDMLGRRKSVWFG